MRPNITEEKNKELLQLYNEYTKLMSEWRNYPIEPLDEPYQKGWDRFFVLREDAANRGDAEVLKSILSRLNYTQHSPNKDFVRKGRRRKDAKEIEQPLRSLSDKQYESLSEQEKAWFVESISWKKWVGEVKQFVFKSPFYFVHKVVPHMVTHRVVPDAAVEARLRELQNHFKVNNLWPRIGKIKGWSNGSYDWEHPRRRLEEKLVDQQVDEFLGSAPVVDTDESVETRVYLP